MNSHLIPKIIHYAWFGGNPKPKLAIQCIDTWKNILPDYELIEWNENNFNIDMNSYTKDAYFTKKYAYVTDVVRLHALYTYGGIYMDTDVEVLKPLDRFLIHEGFSGFETSDSIPTGIIASTKGNDWIGDQLEYYETAKFFDDNGNYNLKTNVETITNISIKKHGLILNGELQTLKYNFVIYPQEFFCPKSVTTGKVDITKNTYTIHHFSGSWVPRRQRINKYIFRLLLKIAGDKKACTIQNIIKKYNNKICDLKKSK